MSTEPKSLLTVEQYLTLERQSETRSEYLNGEVFAMTGASRKHNLLVANILAGVHAQLRGRSCEAYSSDMRVGIPGTGLYTYPDVVVACGQPQFEDGELDTLLNPTLIVEVLSESTEDYGRGTKFAHYRTIPSLAEYVLVAQDKVHVEHFVRQAEGWLLTETDDLAATLDLPSLGCTLALADIYERVFGRNAGE
jgi:Uma2 family endonuclease